MAGLLAYRYFYSPISKVNAKMSRYEKILRFPEMLENDYDKKSETSSLVK